MRDKKRFVEDILIEMGIKADLKCFRHIRDAIYILLDDDTVSTWVHYIL